MRDSIKFIKENLGVGLTGVEIGVREGVHALNIIENLDIKKLYLIDPYQEYPGYGHIDFTKNRNTAAHILKDKNVEWHYKKADKAANNIPSGLDFVYIDGDHRYEKVKLDIENYYPKIRKGGVLAGHDLWRPPVQQAVGELAVGKSLKIYRYIFEPGETWQTVGIDHFDWWIIKEGVGYENN